MRARIALVLVLALTVLVGPLSAATAKNPPPPKSLTAGIDAHYGYKPQRTCSPSAKPGTKALLSALIATWGGSSSGISRLCSVGGTSEHKEGRALDWHMSVYNTSQRARVNDALRWITANNGEVALRLGVMYVIWNQRLWSVYYPELGWRKMADRGSATANHKDHVHISLSWDGAMAQTSWWTGITRAQPLLGPCGTGSYPACLPRIARATSLTWPTTTTPVPLPFLPHPAPYPAFGGSPQVGRTLVAVPGTWIPAGATISYQWLRDGRPISGATAATYPVVAADLGAGLAVKVGASLSGSTLVKTSSAGTDVLPGVFESVRPTIEGTPQTDATLSVNLGTWTPTPTSWTYQWRRDGTAITGATNPTYTVKATDVTHDISVTVTGRSPGFLSVARRSVAVTAVKAKLTATPVPWISGTVATDSLLTAVPGTWAPAPVSLRFQWFRDGAAITGATTASYRLTKADAGRTITVRVKGVKAGYVTVSMYSPPAGSPDPNLVTAAAGTSSGTTSPSPGPSAPSPGSSDGSTPSPSSSPVPATPVPTATTGATP